MDIASTEAGIQVPEPPHIETHCAFNVRPHHCLGQPRPTLTHFSKMKRCLLSALFAASLCLAKEHPRFRNVPGNDFAIAAQNATYDYVVIGGGTAGLAMA
jgi:hypothetical protein